MQPNEYNKESKIHTMPVTKEGTSVKATVPDEKMTFDQLCTCMNNFFNDREYECKQSFRNGYNCVVGEDYSNIDLLCNLNDLVYNYCSNNNNLTKQDRVNFKNLCSGIQQVTRCMEQFNTDTTMNKVLISNLMGYILKITRNYFHDKHW